MFCLHPANQRYQKRCEIRIPSQGNEMGNSNFFFSMPSNHGIKLILVELQIIFLLPLKLHIAILLPIYCIPNIPTIPKAISPKNQVLWEALLGMEFLTSYSCSLQFLSHAFSHRSLCKLCPRGGWNWKQT